MPIAKFEVAEPIHYRIIAFLLLIHYFTLCPWPLTLTFDLWPWTSASYRLWRDETVYQIWTQSNNPHRSYCDFSVWPYDLQHILSVALGSEIIFTKFDLPQLIRTWIIACFDANTLCHAVTLTFDPLTSKVRGTSSVTWSVCTIFQQNRTIPGWIVDNFANFCTRYVSLWP